MSEEMQNYILYPFYRTKEIGKDTGLSLTISYQV